MRRAEDLSQGRHLDRHFSCHQRHHAQSGDPPADPQRRCGTAPSRRRSDRSREAQCLSKIVPGGLYRREGGSFVNVRRGGPLGGSLNSPYPDRVATGRKSRLNLRVAGILGERPVLLSRAAVPGIAFRAGHVLSAPRPSPSCSETQPNVNSRICNRLMCLWIACGRPSAGLLAR